MRHIIFSLAIALLTTSFARGQEHAQILDTAFGAGATQWINNAYSVTPTGSLSDLEAAQQLTRMLNTPDFGPGTTIVLHSEDGEPTIRGIKDDYGKVHFEWLVAAPPPNPTAQVPPRSFSPAVATHLEELFGNGSVEWVSDTYLITSRLNMVDVVAVRELSQLMNSAVVPANTSIRLHRIGGNPLVSGVKDEAGSVTLQSIMSQSGNTPATPPSRLTPNSPTTATPSSRTPTAPLNSSTWGIECTSYGSGNTYGVRCRNL